MTAPSPVLPPPRPLYFSNGMKRPDCYVEEWFPLLVHVDDQYERASLRANAYYQWLAIKDPVLQRQFLDTLQPVVTEVFDDEDIDSSGSSSNANDSPPRPRKRVPPPPSTASRKKNDNTKRARTLRRRQNRNYSLVFHALEPIRHDLDLSDKKFCALLQRYKRELAELRVRESEEYNDSLK